MDASRPEGSDFPNPQKEECQCGSGSFCRRHQCYGKERPYADSLPIDDGSKAASQSFEFHKCGGGRRVMKKPSK